jgi:hypothetical protein
VSCRWRLRMRAGRSSDSPKYHALSHRRREAQWEVASSRACRCRVTGGSTRELSARAATRLVRAAHYTRSKTCTLRGLAGSSTARGQKASHFEKLRFQMVETVKTSGPVLLRSHMSWTVATQARAPQRASRYTVAGTQWPVHSGWHLFRGTLRNNVERLRLAVHA